MAGLGRPKPLDIFVIGVGVLRAGLTGRPHPRKGLAVGASSSIIAAHANSDPASSCLPP